MADYPPPKPPDERYFNPDYLLELLADRYGEDMPTRYYARRLEIGLASLQDWISGKSSPTTETLCRICSRLECRLEDLLSM